MRNTDNGHPQGDLVKYDFDRVIDRTGTRSVKWEFVYEGGRLIPCDQSDLLGKERVLPLWVADMDFPCPQPVVDALIARAQHPIYGYSERTESYYRAVIDWMERRQGWQVDRRWICTTPGVVPAINMLVRTFVSPGERVLVQPPVYYPFFSAIENNGAEIAYNPLLYDKGRYAIDYGDLEHRLQDARIRMLILCNPHNPVGRVWTRQELVRLGEICRAHNVLVVSDEIHGDLILRGNAFTPYASLGEEFREQAIICTAPSKTFNLAGLHVSNIIIPNPEVCSIFQKTLQSNGLLGINPFGLAAVEAAYNEGEDWLAQVLDYVEGNLCYLQEYLREHIPAITVVPPEGTYLVWLDCRALGLDKWQLKHMMLEEARLYLDEGYIFGPQGEGFERINIACPRSVLAQALERIQRAVDPHSSRE